MCGIYGSVLKYPLSHDEKNAVHNIQGHRGPDERGEYCLNINGDKNLTLLHQRLSIIDIEGGKQPFIDNSGNYAITFNGEIFNYRQLKNELEKKGHAFKTDHSDTEVLLKMYIEYGADMLGRLNGMFSFVIFDKIKNKLFMARDRVGIKPLYYDYNQNGIFISSELKTLLLFKDKRTINNQAIIYYLSFQFVPSPQSIINGINKLEPAHYAVYDIDRHQLDKCKYWDLNFNTQNFSFDEWKCRIYDKIESSTKLWSISDVEVGASLSGGLDSSGVVAFFSKNSRNRIKTFTLGFDDAFQLDERELALSVSEKYETEHFEYVLKPDELLKDLDKMVYHLDEPYGGGLPSWYIYKMMKEKVKVALTGSGGDELFGNYKKSNIYNSGPLKKIAYLQRKYISLIRGFAESTRNRKGVFYHRYFTGHEIFHDILICDITDNKKRPEEIIEGYFNGCGIKDVRNIIPYIDYKMQLPEEFLHMTDRFSMAFSIEARVPYLDHELIELIMSVPPEIRMKRHDPKYLLREAIKDVLPGEILSAEKRGFVLPVNVWIKNELREEIECLLGEEYLSDQGIFKRDIYKKIVYPYVNGKKDNSSFVWTLYMFQKWYDIFIKKRKFA